MIIECKHCEGTCICKQFGGRSETVVVVEEDDDGIYRRNETVYYVSCPLCGEKRLKDVSFGLFPLSLAGDEKLVCKPCGGKGYHKGD